MRESRNERRELPEKERRRGREQELMHSQLQEWQRQVEGEDVQRLTLPLRRTMLRLKLAVEIGHRRTAAAREWPRDAAS